MAGRDRPILQKGTGATLAEGEEVQRCDVLSGGFPCQDISVAGNGAGLEGERSGLWREYLRTIRVVRPKYAVVENVAALLGRGLGRVLGDLAESGYDAEWDCLPACAFGAHHERDRIFIIAYPASERPSGPRAYREPLYSPPDGFGEAVEFVTFIQRENLPYVCRRHDGFSAELDGPALTALGNAVVPQIAEWIGRRIIEAEENK